MASVLWDFVLRQPSEALDRSPHRRSKPLTELAGRTEKQCSQNQASEQTLASHAGTSERSHSGARQHSLHLAGAPCGADDFNATPCP